MLIDLFMINHLIHSLVLLINWNIAKIINAINFVIFVFSLKSGFS